MKKYTNNEKPGQECPCCHGSGVILQHEDAHRSEGWIPCPRGLWHGENVLVCDSGILVEAADKWEHKKPKQKKNTGGG